jgi:hypothetical protein
VNHPGIAFHPRADRSMSEIIRSLTLIDEVISPEETKGRVEFI